MPDTEPLSLRTAGAARFALPCPVPRAIRYLSDPHVLLAAVPGIQRAVLRQRATYRVTLAPVQAFSRRVHPVAEVAIIAHTDTVRITSAPMTSQDAGQDEIPIALDAALTCTRAADGCAVRVLLAVDAALPAHVLPPLVPRAFVLRSLETLLARRLQGEIDAMARLLRDGYPDWAGPHPADAP